MKRLRVNHYWAKTVDMTTKESVLSHVAITLFIGIAFSAPAIYGLASKTWWMAVLFGLPVLCCLFSIAVEIYCAISDKYQ